MSANLHKQPKPKLENQNVMMPFKNDSHLIEKQIYLGECETNVSIVL